MNLNRVLSNAKELNVTVPHLHSDECTQDEVVHVMKRMLKDILNAVESRVYAPSLLANFASVLLQTCFLDEKKGE